MTIADLMTPIGRAVLADAHTHAATGADPLRASAALRKAGYAPDLVAAALTQVGLRERARAKFGDAALTMWFTSAGVQQASRAVVATEHARRLAASGAARVVDVGCGIGGDSRAFAQTGTPVLAVDADEQTAAVAAANLADFPRAQVRCMAAEDVELRADDAVFFDPARRDSQGRRTHDVADYMPGFQWALRKCRSVLAGGMKCAPALGDDDLPAGLGDGESAQWISVDGDVVEVGLWCGAAAAPGVARSALQLSATDPGARVEVCSTSRERQVVPAGALAEFIGEPDGAAIRAGVLGDLAARCDASLVDESIAYFTADSFVQADPWVRWFRVLEVFPLQPKVLARALAARGVGAVTIKKRGTDVTPEALRKKLKLKGSGHATLICTRLAGGHRALLVDRVH